MRSDLLDRYKNLSNKLQVNYIDPDKKPDLARAAGIRSYGSIVVQNGLKKQEAKSLSEEEITGALIRSLKSGDHTACFVTGSGEVRHRRCRAQRPLRIQDLSREEQLQDARPSLSSRSPKFPAIVPF